MRRLIVLLVGLLALSGCAAKDDTSSSSSTTVLLIALDDTCDQEKLIRDYNLTLVYDYVNFSMIAVSTQESDLDTLKAQLLKEQGVLSVEEDSTLELDEDNC